MPDETPSEGPPKGPPEGYELPADFPGAPALPARRKAKVKQYIRIAEAKVDPAAAGDKSIAIRASERQMAARRMGLERLPFSGTLGVAFRSVPGGFSGIMDYIPHLANAGDERYKRLLWLYQTASGRDQSVLSPEDFLAAAGIAPAEFIGDIARIIFQVNADVGVIVNAISHPAVVETAVKAAKRVKGGAKDREMLFKATGFLPTPHGPAIQINNTNTAIGGPSDTGMPSFEDTIRAATDKLRAAGPVVDITPSEPEE